MADEIRRKLHKMTQLVNNMEERLGKTTSEYNYLIILTWDSWEWILKTIKQQNSKITLFRPIGSK